MQSLDYQKRIIFIAVLLPILWELVSSVHIKEFLTLSYKQKLLLDELKARVSPNLPYEYMKEEVYLIRWLRDSEFDTAKAEKKLLKNVQWRKENKIDSILEEDWKYYDEEYRYFVEGCDKEGKRVVSIYMGDWDIRREIIAGKGKRLMRYGDRLGEEASINVRKILQDGENVTQSTIIMDMKNFNIAQHACPQCLAVHLYILNTLQEHYPEYIHKVFVVNTPNYALPFWDTLRPFMVKSLRNILSIHGTNKREWQTELFKEIDPAELSRNFGGTRAEPTDLRDIRKTEAGYYKCTK